MSWWSSRCAVEPEPARCRWCGRAVFGAEVHPCCEVAARTSPASPCVPCIVSADRARVLFGEERGRDRRSVVDGAG